MPPLVANAFDKCEQLDQPKWLRFLPADANDLWREDFLEPAPKARFLRRWTQGDTEARDPREKSLALDRR